MATGIAAEHEVPASRKFAFLAIYFLLNLSLTLYNKAVLGKFAFPWILTAIHAASASIGCYGLMLRGVFTLTRLSTHEHMALVTFSLLFTVNIAMSNISLAMVSVPFHQIMRSTCPVFTVIIYRMWYRRTYPRATYLSLLPLVLGVGLATYGDYYFTTLGFLCTLLGALLAVFKASPSRQRRASVCLTSQIVPQTIASNRLMTGSLALPALEILLRMSPLAAVQSFLYAGITGELTGFLTYIREGHLTSSTCLALIGNGLIAFWLNVASFQANKLAGALTMAVCANVKQCLTVVLGIVLFDVTVSRLNGAGIVVALLGAAWYSKVELESKGNGKVTASAPHVLPVTKQETVRR